MSVRILPSTMTREVRSGTFQVVPRHGGAARKKDEKTQPVGAGKVSLAYQGGGAWVLVAFDQLNRRSVTSHIRVKSTGEIVGVDPHTKAEKPYGKFPLGQNGIPGRHTEVDLFKHFDALECLLADEIAMQYREANARISPRVSLDFKRN